MTALLISICSFFPFQSWIVAYTRRGLAQVDLLTETGERFPYVRFFNAKNYRIPYPYRNPDTATDAVWGLQEDQVGRTFQLYLS